MENQKSRIVYLNGKYIEEKNAKLSIYDSSLMFGDMVFEMTRSFDKKHFLLEEHIDRLYKSANYLEIPVSISRKKMIEECYKVSEMNEKVFDEDDEHRLMINLSRGLLSLYDNKVDVESGSNVIIADFPLKWTVSGMDVYFKKGINAVIPSQRMISSNLLEAKVKNRNRIHYMMANIEVSKFNSKNTWALLMDDNGYITEGTGSNFFMIKDNIIFTPEPRNLLRGISRDYVINLARKNKIEVIEKNLELYDLLEADEAFFTATPFCILPITSVNFKSICKPGNWEMTNRLLSLWNKEVGIDIVKQIENWNSSKTKASPGMSTYSFKK